MGHPVPAFAADSAPLTHHIASRPAGKGTRVGTSLVPGGDPTRQVGGDPAIVVGDVALAQVVYLNRSNRVVSIDSGPGSRS